MKVKKRAPTAPPGEPPTEVQCSEQIAALAHALWESRGCPEGTADEDWYQAERMLLEKR